MSSMSPRSEYERELSRLNRAATEAARAASFPKFIECLDRYEIRLNVSYGDLVLTDGGVGSTAYAEISKLPCGPLLRRRLHEWGVPLAGGSVTKVADNFIQLRRAWARASDYQEDLPNLGRHAGAYLHWSDQLSLPELEHAVGITFAKGLPSESDRGAFFCGVCRNKHAAKRRP